MRDFSEDDLRLHLLMARRRKLRAISSTSESEEADLDIQGIAEVLGSRLANTRAVLGELVAEGFVEASSDSFGRGVLEGRCSTNGLGLTHLRVVRASRAEPYFVTIDDIGSFEKGP